MDARNHFHTPESLTPLKGLRYPLHMWMGTKAGLDTVVKRKIPASAGDGTPVAQPASHLL